MCLKIYSEGRLRFLNCDKREETTMSSGLKIPLTLGYFY